MKRVERVERVGSELIRLRLLESSMNLIVD